MKNYKVKLTIHSNGHKVYEYEEVWYFKLISLLKKRLSISNINKQEAYDYMKEEWKKTNPSYLKYFDKWFENITEYQLYVIFIWMKNKLGPFI